MAKKLWVNLLALAVVKGLKKNSAFSVSDPGKSWAAVCILRFFDSWSSRVYCDNATKVMCVVDVIFGQECLTEQFISMRFFYDSIFLLTIQCSSPSEHFAFNALFLWEHSLCAPESAERRLAAPGENSWNGRTLQDPLWNFEQKMALTLRPTSQVYCSPSSSQTNIIIKTVLYNIDLKPPSFIWRQGIHALQ